MKKLSSVWPKIPGVDDVPFQSSDREISGSGRLRPASIARGIFLVHHTGSNDTGDMQHHQTECDVCKRFMGVP